MRTNLTVVGAMSLAMLSLVACKDQSQVKGVARTEFFDKSGVDSSVKPGDNFFLYANGNWIRNTQIPDDQSGWGSFNTLYEDNLKKLHSILQDGARANATKGSLQQKAGDFYASGMDTTAIEKLDADPLKPGLAKIDAITNYKDLMNFIAEGYKSGFGDLMGFNVGSDEKNSAQNIPVFGQAGLSLPEKEYYTRTDSATKAARNAFVTYATRLFTLTGADSVTAGKNAQAILALETKISASHRTPAETRDPQKNYNKISVADLQKTEPNIGWDNFFSHIGAKPDSVNVAQPGYFIALNTLLASEPIDTWKTKLKYDYIAANANQLTKAFRDASFAYSKTFTGQKIQSERWKTIVNQTDGSLGDIVGQLYVQQYFTDAAKQRMDELVNNLQKAFERRINKLDWMSDSTKQRAVVKLHAFLKKVGYPTKWKSYDDVNVNPNDYFGNVVAARIHAQNEMIGKIGKPVDRMEWGMTTPTVNAYYNPTNNEIVFPAGILQFPFFDPNADDAINYGGIGMAIGHEMTHGFDDQGSQYDEKGNMKNWWSMQDNQKFKGKTGSVVTQYSNYTLLDSLHIKGDLTLGENIADLGGLAIAYDAFKMTKQGQSNEKIDGYTPDQRFFLSFAQIWRSKYRDEITRMLLNVDPHSPSMYRVNGPLSNFEPFYTAFNVKEGDKLYVKPENRIKIW